MASAKHRDSARAALLEAAIELFSERGYAATSVGSICERAGVTKPALYWHFDSKEGLMAAVLEGLSGTWIEEIQKQASQAGSPQERLDRMMAAWRSMIEETPQLLRLPLVAALERSDSADARSAVLRIWDRSAEAIATGIREALGGIEVRDLDLVGDVVVALLNNAMVRFSVEGDEEHLERQLDEVQRAIRSLVRDHIENPKS